MPTLPQPKTIDINGVDITYIEKGQGVPVVFVHGGLVDFRSWAFQIDPFAQHYHVIAYSRRYHYPNSGADQASKYLATDNRDDLAELIRALQLAPAHIVASSYGAYISLLLACTRPELVRSLALGEPPVPTLFGPEAVQSMGEQVEPARQAFQRGDPEQAIRGFQDRVAGPGGFDRFPAPARQMMLDNAPEFNLEVNTSPDLYFSPFSCEDARTIRVPVLLVNGEESPQFLYQMTDMLEQCLSSAERAVIPHASHGMHNLNPQAYNETVLAFLDRH
ncbi:MAG: alpha/beta fold hydrolase [Omnitrophica WOR_2 bacterium]